MTRLITFETSKLSEIWETNDDFLDYLLEKAPTSFKNQYLLDTTIQEQTIEMYSVIAEYYEDNMISGSEKLFMINFRNRFTDLLPGYWNMLNGELSEIVNPNTIGDFSFNGEQQNTDLDNPFGTPRTTDRYTFRQLSGEQLKNALKERAGELQNFIHEFSDLFQYMIEE